MSQKLPGAKELPIGGVVPYPGSSLEYKTGSWRVERPVIDQEKCVRCRLCWYICPDGAIKELDKEYVTSKGKKWNLVYEVNYDYCKGCGACSEICPVKAIKMVPEEA